MKNHVLRFLAVLLIALLLFPASTASAERAFNACGKPGSDVAWTLDADGLLSVTGRGEMEDYGPFDDTPWDAFRDSIRRLAVSEGVTAVGSRAFFQCANLRAVSFPDSLVSIGDAAFCGCTALEELVLPPHLESLGRWAFEDCDNLVSVSLPDTLSSIGNYAFGYCMKLEKIALPENVIEIGEGTFRCCKALRSVSLPSQLRAIGARAFQECESLVWLRLPEGLRAIGEYALYGTGLTDLALPESVSFLERHIFPEGDFMALVTGSSHAEIYCLAEHFKCCRVSKPLEIGLVAETGQVLCSVRCPSDANGTVLVTIGAIRDGVEIPLTDEPFAIDPLSALVEFYVPEENRSLFAPGDELDAHVLLRDSETGELFHVYYATLSVRSQNG